MLFSSKEEAQAITSDGQRFVHVPFKPKGAIITFVMIVVFATSFAGLFGGLISAVDRKPENVWLLAGIFAIHFTFVLVMALLDEVIVIDKQQSTISHAQTLGMPIWKSKHAYADFKAVVVSQHIQNYNGRIYLSFPVEFRGPNNALLIEDELDRWPAIKLARRIAEFCNLPVVNELPEIERDNDFLGTRQIRERGLWSRPPRVRQLGLSTLIIATLLAAMTSLMAVKMFQSNHWATFFMPYFAEFVILLVIYGLEHSRAVIPSADALDDR